MQVKEQGLIKRIGVSNVSLNQLKEYCQHGHIDIVQNRFSLINRSFNEEFLDFCRQRRIAIVAYQVIERGLLTDRADNSVVPGPSDLRAKKPEFSTKPREIIRVWVRDFLRPIAQGLGIGTESLAITWALQAPGIAVALCGASKVEQLTAFDSALGTSLNDVTLGEIDAAYERLTRDVREAGYPSVRAMMGLE
jgi:methylglyoxal reductase